MADKAVDARLSELESHVAESEKTIDELNAVVQEQWKAIELLKAEVEVLGRQILQMTEGTAETALHRER
jgi:uncharacterized coiled-coil protein SlyX